MLSGAPGFAYELRKSGLRRRERRIYGERSTTQSLLEDDPLSNVERP